MIDIVAFYASGSENVAMYVKLLSFNIYQLPLKSWVLYEVQDE